MMKDSPSCIALDQARRLTLRHLLSGFALVLGIAVAPGINAQASPTCEQVFSGGASKFDLKHLRVDAPETEDYQRIWLREARAGKFANLPDFKMTLLALERWRSRDYSPTTDVKIPSNQSALKAIKHNLENLLTAENVAKYEFSPEDRQFFNSVIKETNRLLHADQVAYEDYINVCFYFQVAMSRRTERAHNLGLSTFQGVVSPELIDPQLPKGKWSWEIKMVVEQAPRLLVVPTMRGELPFEDYEVLRPFPVYYIGMVTEPGHDGRGELNFFGHDFSHAIYMATQDITDMGTDLSPHAMEIFLKNRIAFGQRFETELNGIKNEKLKSLVRYQWWYNYHAEDDHLDGSYSPNGFSRQFQSTLASSREVQRILQGLSPEEQRLLRIDASHWLKDLQARIWKELNH